MNPIALCERRDQQKMGALPTKNQQTSNTRLITRLMFKLLPVQVILTGIGAVNGIVSSYFASNYVGIDAMSAVGLYSPINMLITAVSTMLAGGSAILYGKYMGRNEQNKVQDVFSMNLLLAALAAGVSIAAFLIFGLLDWTGVFTGDAAVRGYLNQYLLGMAIGIFPMILGYQLPTYLAMENRQKRTLAASLIYIAANVMLNYLFVQVLRMEAFGLALAASLGLWIFCGVQAVPFVGSGSFFRLKLRRLSWAEGWQIIRVGLPGAATSGYEAVRKVIINSLMQAYIGTVALSSFTASDSILRIIWAIPYGMIAVSRLLISVAIGEEDRQTLTDITRVMFRRYVPLMCAISGGIMLCARPFTGLFFHDPAEPVYTMTVWGFRILPLCMPFSVIRLHFSCYAQAIGRQKYANVTALLAGLVFVTAFTAILIPWMKMNSVYLANVLNGIACCLVVVLYSRLRIGHFPRSIEDLMVIPGGFGTKEDERIDISVRSIDEVVSVSRKVCAFCRSRGIDERRVFLSGLCLEEMAGNIVQHGFPKDRKHHSIDVRVVHKGDDVILRIRDDCLPFNPGDRKELLDSGDALKNVGIRIVYRIARDIDYQNIMGLNVLTIRI